MSIPIPLISSDNDPYKAGEGTDGKAEAGDDVDEHPLFGIAGEGFAGEEGHEENGER